MSDVLSLERTTGRGGKSNFTLSLISKPVQSDAKKTAGCKWVLIEAELFNFAANNLFKSETPVCTNIG